MTEVESDGSVATADPTIAGVAKAHVVKRSKQRSLPIRFIRSQPLGALALFMILLFVSVAILAPIISPYDPVAQDRRAILTAPGPGHLLGTDVIGRDIFSRILYGARTSLLVSVATVTIGMSIGVSIGIFSGFFGGRWIDTILQRILEPLLAIPAIVLLMFVAAMLGPSVRNTIIAESALSFLGIGPPPPNASWGGMLSAGAPTMEVAPWGVIFPGAALSIAVLAFNLLGDSLREFLDPKRSSR